MKKKKKKNKVQKVRNWLVLHAKGLTGRKGAGFHESKKYSRKEKHKKKNNNEE